MAAKYKNKLNPKGGRERVRRSFIVYVDTFDKLSYIARVEGVFSSELLQQIADQAVTAWEQEHGEIKLGNQARPSIDLGAAIQGAKNAPTLKRGNPHPTGRKRKTQPKREE